VGHRRIIESSTSQLRDIFTGLRYICKKLFHLHCTGQISFHRKKKTLFGEKFPKILEIISLSAISSLYIYTMISKAILTSPTLFTRKPQKIHFANRAKDLPNGIAMAAPELSESAPFPDQPTSSSQHFRTSCLERLTWHVQGEKKARVPGKWQLSSTKRSTLGVDPQLRPTNQGENLSHGWQYPHVTQ